MKWAHGVAITLAIVGIALSAQAADPNLPPRQWGPPAIAPRLKMPSDVNTTRKMSRTDIFETYANAVVLLKVSWEADITPDEVRKLPPDQQPEALESLRRHEPVKMVHNALGAAVAISPSTLLTNCHVVDVKTEIYLPRPTIDPTGKRILIFQRMNRPILLGKVVEAHPDIDICVIETVSIYFPPRPGTIPAAVEPIKGIRPFSNLKVGETVIAIGHPVPDQSNLGSLLEWSLTDGVISGLRSNEQLNKRGKADIIQISAPITHGNSGGALFDEYGNLIGITQGGFENQQGFNFAIAADLLWRRYRR